jgi:hypothetical protein
MSANVSEKKEESQQKRYKRGAENCNFDTFCFCFWQQISFYKKNIKKWIIELNCWNCLEKYKF